MTDPRNNELVLAGRSPGAMPHSRSVVTSITEKVLINLEVLSHLKVGDKLDWTAAGHFVIQKPGYWTTAWRFVTRAQRWDTLGRVQDTINTAETMEGMHNDTRLREGLVKCIHGIRNLQSTYLDDTLMGASLNVLLNRLALTYGLSGEDTL